MKFLILLFTICLFAQVVGQSPYLNVLNFGADPTGISDSTAAFTSAFTQAGVLGVNTVFCPAGTYKVTSFSVLPSMKLTGVQTGNTSNGGCRLIGTSAGTMVTLSDGGLGAGSTSRSGGIDHIYIECNHVAKIGLYMGLRVDDHSFDMIVNGCLTYNTVLDATQNSELDGFENRNCVICLGLVNGAANNQLNRIENTTATTTPLYIGLDATLPNTSYAGASFGGLANSFVMCQLENGTFSTAANLSTAYYNNFYGCTIVDSGSASILITLGSGATGNNFWGGYIATARNIPIISNNAYDNSFNGVFINLLPGCTTAIIATSLLNINNISTNDPCFFNGSNWSISGSGQIQVNLAGPTLFSYTCSGSTCGYSVNPTPSSSTAQVQLNPVDNVGNRVSATYNCSWITLGCWWTLPRTVGLQGYHWQNNTNTDLMFLDGGDSSLTTYGTPHFANPNNAWFDFSLNCTSGTFICPTYAQLIASPFTGAPSGAATYCRDCNTTCTAGSSTGSYCFRENGIWNGHGSGSGGSYAGPTTQTVISPTVGGGPYHNTGTTPQWITVTGAGAGVVYCDSSSSPTTVAGATSYSLTSSGNGTVTFVVLPTYYWKITGFSSVYGGVQWQ